MEETNVNKTFGELLEALNRQQANFQALMQHQFAVSEARLDALASKPLAARKAQPPKYQGKVTEDLELCFSPPSNITLIIIPRWWKRRRYIFVTMISCHLG